MNKIPTSVTQFSGVDETKVLSSPSKIQVRERQPDNDKFQEARMTGFLGSPQTTPFQSSLMEHPDTGEDRGNPAEVMASENVFGGLSEPKPLYIYIYIIYILIFIYCMYIHIHMCPTLFSQAPIPHRTLLFRCFRHGIDGYAKMCIVSRQ